MCQAPPQTRPRPRPGPPSSDLPPRTYRAGSLPHPPTPGPLRPRPPKRLASGDLRLRPSFSSNGSRDPASAFAGPSTSAPTFSRPSPQGPPQDRPEPLHALGQFGVSELLPSPLPGRTPRPRPASPRERLSPAFRIATLRFSSVKLSGPVSPGNFLFRTQKEVTLRHKEVSRGDGGRAPPAPRLLRLAQCRALRKALSLFPQLYDGVSLRVLTRYEGVEAWRGMRSAGHMLLMKAKVQWASIRVLASTERGRSR